MHEMVASELLQKDPVLRSAHLAIQEGSPRSAEAANAIEVPERDRKARSDLIKTCPTASVDIVPNKFWKKACKSSPAALLQTGHGCFLIMVSMQPMSALFRFPTNSLGRQWHDWWSLDTSTNGNGSLFVGAWAACCG